MSAAPESGTARSSPDLRVWEPCKLIVELQARTELGSQSALFSANLVDDIERVRRGAADAFVLAADHSLYDGLRGIKSDARGRKAKYPNALGEALPPSECLGTDFEPFKWPVVQRPNLICTGTRLRTRYGIERCILGISST
jgi:hypothetical protein